MTCRKLRAKNLIKAMKLDVAEQVLSCGKFEVHGFKTGYL